MRISPGRAGRLWVVGSALLVAVVAVGCGGPRTGTVRGKVYLKDAPLKGGRVTFLSPETQHSLQATIGEDGSYAIENVPAGTVKIAVETESLKKKASIPKNAPPPGMSGGSKTNTDPKEAARHYVPIPKQYADVKTSGLEYTVAGGTQEHDVKLLP